MCMQAHKAESACEDHLADAERGPRSGKLDRVVELAAAAQAEGEQMLVFSQWTATLDLLEPALGSRGIRYSRCWALTPLPHSAILRP